MRAVRRSLVLAVLALVAAVPASAQAAGALDAQYEAPQCDPGATLPSVNVSATSFDEGAQTFIPEKSGQLDQVDLKLFTHGVTAALTVEIRTTTAGEPGATVLGSGSLPASSAPDSSSTFVSVPLTSPAPVSAGVRYAIVIRSTTEHPGWQWCGDFEATYPGGQAWSRFGFPDPSAGTWSSPFANADLGFRTYVTPSGPPHVLAAQYGAPQCFPGATEASVNVSASDFGEGAQTFVPSTSGQLDQVDLVLFTHGVSAPVTVEIRSASGGVPGNDVLGSGSLPVTANPGSSAHWLSIPLTSPAPVTAGIQYTIVISSTTPDPGWQWCGDLVGTYADGQTWNRFGAPPSTGTWMSPFPTADLGFKAYVTPGGSEPHTPVTLTVDDDKVQCPAAGYTTIHAAIDAAGPGDTINVCRGTYSGEHVVDVDDVDIVSSTAAQAAVVNAPNSNAFYIEGGTQDVSVRRFRINGTPGNSSAFVGKEDASYELIKDNVITGFRDGIELLGGGDAELARDNHISGFTNSGIELSNENTFADLRSNTIIGGAGTRGIEFGPSTKGLAFGNTVSKNGDAGIYLAGDGQAAKANTVSQGGVGIFVDFGAGSVENNKVGSNTQQGLKVTAGGYTFVSNNAKGNGGVDCQDSTGGSGTAGTANTWTGNYGLESSPVGICKP